MWEMGGYAVYVLPAFTLVLGGMLVLAFSAYQQSKKLKNQLMAQNTKYK